MPTSIGLPPPVFIQSWGTNGSGPGQFDEPVGIAIHDASGQIYVADSGNDRVQRFSTDGVYLGQWGSTGTQDGQFRQPRSISVDQATGSVFVAEQMGNRVQRFSPAGFFQLRWGSNGTEPGQFIFPSGLHVDSLGRVYVAEVGGGRVQRFSANGTFQLQFGSLGGDPDQFNLVEDIAFSGPNTLIAVDSGESRFLRFQINEAVTPPPQPFPNVPTDATGPTIKVKGRRSIDSLSNRVVFRGTASDDTDVAGIEFKVSGQGGFQVAKGTTSWKAVVRPDKNKRITVVRVRAIDSAGNKSSFLKLKIFRR